MIVNFFQFLPFSSAASILLWFQFFSKVSLSAEIINCLNQYPTLHQDIHL